MTPILDTIQQATRPLSGVAWAEADRLSDVNLVAALAAAEELGRFADAARIFLAGEVAEALANGLIGVDTAHTILSSLKQAATGSEATPENMTAADWRWSRRALPTVRMRPPMRAGYRGTR